ncbi:zincin-like metallopeptidase domain-containing protein [Paenalcaligenes hermetiae]|uniref:Zincin-like metallopeptidase domain-containing protein n=2 Tax=Paenalcaligenes hermetiae TaxID=1157987 RepID=A0ABP9M6X4_9BURK
MGFSMNKAKRKPFHEEIAEQLIAQLKEGAAPWQVPWETGYVKERPYNVVTGKPYQGRNSIALMLTGYADPRWMTFNQAKEAGYSIKKGSKGTRLQMTIWQEERLKRDETGQVIENSEGEQEKEIVEREKPIVKSFTVFNAEQINGIPPLERPVVHAWQAIERAENILEASGAVIEHKRGNKAYYSPVHDKIVLPLKDQFPSPDRYYATALHELGHWTGHESRLHRFEAGVRESKEEYAKEELRAEIASMMIGQTLGIGHDPGQHAAYVESWIKVLQDDPMEIIHAAKDAEKIHSFVLEFERQREQDSTRDLSVDELKQAFEKALDNAEPELVKQLRFLETSMSMIVQNMPEAARSQAQQNFYSAQLEKLSERESEVEIAL